MPIAFLKTRQKYRADLKLASGENKHIGLYSTKEDAKWALQQAREEYGALAVTAPKPRSHKGIYFMGWKVIVKINGTPKYIGTFKTLEAALNAQLKAQKDH